MAYSESVKSDMIAYVLAKIAEGNSVREIFANRIMIDGQRLCDRTTFFDWIDKDTEKANQYARAMELRQEKIFEEILEIADTPQEGITKKETEKGIEITTGDMIQHRRLQVDARKWMLGKMNPKKYGDRLETENNHSGEITIVRQVKK